MTSDSFSAGVYTDFQGLAKLKAEAGRQSPEATREAARQFEALFVQMMLKSMRDASPEGGLFESKQTEFYTEMYDRQIALDMVKGKGIGIASMLEKEIGGAAAQVRDAAAVFNGVVPARSNIRADVVAATLKGPEPIPGFSARPLEAVAITNDIGNEVFDWRPESSADFIGDVWPHAQRGAAELGVNPEVLVAQAALESGWGKHMIRHEDGRASFNLFGIKADSNWAGDRVSVQTLEYRDGVAVKTRASFRAYSTLGAAVDDYVDFLGSNPRYRAALEKGPDSAGFLQGLQDAGYATDPQYAHKIQQILLRNLSGDDLVSMGVGASDTVAEQNQSPAKDRG